jgi:hypothetical protein
VAARQRGPGEADPRALSRRAAGTAGDDKDSTLAERLLELAIEVDCAGDRVVADQVAQLGADRPELVMAALVAFPTFQRADSRVHGRLLELVLADGRAAELRKRCEQRREKPPPLVRREVARDALERLLLTLPDFALRRPVWVGVDEDGVGLLDLNLDRPGPANLDDATTWVGVEDAIEAARGWALPALLYRPGPSAPWVRLDLVDEPSAVTWAPTRTRQLGPRRAAR